MVEICVVGEEDEKPSEPGELGAVRAHCSYDEEGAAVADASLMRLQALRWLGVKEEGKDAEVFDE